MGFSWKKQVGFYTELSDHWSMTGGVMWLDMSEFSNSLRMNRFSGLGGSFNALS